MLDIDAAEAVDLEEAESVLTYYGDACHRMISNDNLVYSQSESRYDVAWALLLDQD